MSREYRHSKRIGVVTCLLTALLLTGCGQAHSQQGATANALTFRPGSYTGSGTGIRSEIVVRVDIGTHGQLQDITVVSHGDTPGFALPTFEILRADILHYGSTNVDLIAGATSSARGFRWAVEDALVQAGANLAQLRPGAATDTPLPIIATNADTSQAVASQDAQADTTDETTTDEGLYYIEATAQTEALADTDAITPAEETPTVDDTLHNDTATEETTPEPEPSVVDEPSVPALFVAGTHTLTVQGYMGIISVQVSFDAMNLSAIEIISHNETPAFWDMVWGDSSGHVLRNQLLGADPLNLGTVDVMSGATASSQAVIQAVQQAVQLALVD